jgi:hypothetical protein
MRSFESSESENLKSNLGLSGRLKYAFDWDG